MDQHLPYYHLALVYGSSVSYVYCAAIFINRGRQRLAYGKGESGLAVEEEKWAIMQGNEYLGVSVAYGKRKS